MLSAPVATGRHVVQGDATYCSVHVVLAEPAVGLLREASAWLIVALRRLALPRQRAGEPCNCHQLPRFSMIEKQGYYSRWCNSLW